MFHSTEHRSDRGTFRAVEHEGTRFATVGLSASPTTTAGGTIMERDGVIDVADATTSAQVGGTRQIVGTIERALTVLDLMASSDQVDMGVTEIARELGLSKAVIHRVLTTLVARDYLQVDDTTRRYRLGPMALVLGSAYLDRLDLRNLALPRLQELSARTGETATFSLRNGFTRMYVDQVTPDREIKMSVAIGKSFPLHAGSSSKSFLAFLSEDEREAYIRDRELTPLTGTTIVDADRLRAELATIRERGYAISLEERQAGAGSLAAPILDRTGRPIGAISVCGPVERFRAQMETIPPLLLAACQDLSRQFGHRADGAA